MKITLELESFTGFIEVVRSQYIPTRVVVSKGVIREKQLAFCSTMDAAVRAVVLEIFSSNDDEVTMSQFLIKYQSITNQLESLVNIEA